MIKTKHFKRKILASSVASCIVASLAAPAMAQDGELIEITVVGHRRAQTDSINVKRNSDRVMDGIVAIDIGKLPDVTIADSLQRISGIQVQRSAGEGDKVNVRGLPQVTTQLNGEVFLSAGSINTVQPSFADLPSQLFKGANVYKTSSANMSTAGITGTVDLRSWRPFDFEEGVTLSGGAEIQRGQDTKETDPVINGLYNWRNEKMGVQVSAAFGDVNLANYYNGFNTGDPVGDSGWVNGVNDWGGSQTYNTLSPQGLSAWNQVTERERIGLNGAFQYDLGEGFELVAEVFHTEQEEYNRKVGLSATNKWSGLEWYNVTQGRATGDVGGTGDREWQAWQELELDARRVKSFTQNDSYANESTNYNLELNFDDGGRITGSARLMHGNATRERRHGYNEGDMTDGIATSLDPFYPAEYCGTATPVGDAGGCFVSPNPLGYTTIPQVTYNSGGEHPVWGGFDRVVAAGGLPAGSTLQDYMSNLGSYNIGAFSSENNADSEAELDILRLDGSYEFDEGGFFTSVDVGVRSSRRGVDEERYHLFSPFYSEGCEAQWKATDVVLNNTAGCTSGELVGGEFQGYTVLPPTALDAHNNVSFVTDFGPVGGIPGVWAVDPSDYDDPAAFHNRVFGSTSRAIIPGTSYNVDLDEETYYIQGNFDAGRFTGNVGLRIIDSSLTVKQNIAGAVKPYGNTNFDDGDIVASIDNTEYLPALNVAYEASDDVVVRFAAAKNTTPLDFNLWGDGLSVDTSRDPETGIFVVNDFSEGGNPTLEAWKSNNFDLSVEWYLGDSSMLSAAAFYVDIDSFVEENTTSKTFTNADGSPRTILGTTQTQGEGGSIKGLELSAKLAFGDFTDGFLRSFGVDTNYTYSPSEQEGVDITGSKLPFPENSEKQFNLIGWYENGPFQARIAYNYRSERLAERSIGGASLAVYQDEVDYVDLSGSYDINDRVTVYLSGSNVTGSFEDYYVQWTDQAAYQNVYETRYTLGVRARF